MKNYLIPLLTVLLLAGCQPAQTVPPVEKTPGLPSYVYPNRNANPGEKYGAMTFEKISDDSMYALFKGTATVSGEYQYFGDEELSSLRGRVCVTFGGAEAEQIPISEAFFTPDVTERFLCFSNNDNDLDRLG